VPALTYNEWIGRRGGMSQPQTAQGMGSPSIDWYSLQPHQREQALAAIRQASGASPRQTAIRRMIRPSMEEVSKREGWYDQPEWVRTQLLRDMGYGQGGS
jgi:chlorite dismutase